MTDYTRESVEAWERHRAESRAALIAFCETEDITLEQFAESRARAVAKMREPRQRWRVIIVENPGPRHHLTVVTPDPVARGLDAFLARYTDDDLGAMLVDLVVSLRRRSQHQRWLDTVLPSMSVDEMAAAIAEHMADLADRVNRWREELTGARALRTGDPFEGGWRGMGGA